MASCLFPLHTAVCDGHDDVTMTQSLLDSSKCQVNEQDSCGLTAMMKAAHSNNVNNIRCLITRGGDINIVDDSQMNVLHHAIDYGSLAAIELLLEQCSKNPKRREKFINAKSIQGVTPLIRAAEINFIPAFKVLLQCKAHMNAKTDQGWTALHLAAAKKFASIVSLLIDNKADLDTQTANCETPLSLATANNNIYIVGLLVSAHADVNIPDRVGNTPSHIAAKYGHLEIMTRLVKQSCCDLQAVNKDKQTVMDLATSNNHEAVKDLLMVQQPRTARGVKTTATKSTKDHSDQLKYNTMKRLQKASVVTIQKTIHESYSRLTEIQCTVRQRRSKKRKPLSAISQWEKDEPTHLEVNDSRHTKTLLRGEKHVDISPNNRTTLGMVEQGQIVSQCEADGLTGETEADCKVIQKTKAMAEEVKEIEVELRSVTGDSSGSVSPGSDCCSNCSWTDMFNKNSKHQFMQNLYHKLSLLFMEIESLHSTVRTCVRFSSHPLCPLQDIDVDHGDLTDLVLYGVADLLGKDWMSTGVQLGLSHSSMECLEQENNRDIKAASRKMLIRWRNSSQLTNSQKKKELTKVLQNVGRNDIVGSIPGIVSYRL